MSDIVTNVIEERDKRYSNTPFSKRARIAQNLKAVVRSSEYYWELSPSEKEAIDMILHKIARIVGGEILRHDSWIDIAGYAKLVVMDDEKEYM